MIVKVNTIGKSSKLKMAINQLIKPTFGKSDIQGDPKLAPPL